MNKINTTLENTLNNLIIFFPVVFFLRSLTINITVILISIIFIILCITKKYNFLKYEYNKLLLLFFVYFFSLQFFHDTDLEKIIKSFFLLKFFLLFNATIYVFSNVDVIKLKKKFLYLSTIICIFIIDLYIQYYFGKNILGFSPSFCIPGPGCLRYSGMFGSELVAGGYLSIIGISVFFLLHTLFNKKFNNFVPLIILFSVFITGERTALILVILFNLIFLLFYIKIDLKKLLVISLIIFSFIFFSKDVTIKRYSKDTINLIKNDDNLSLVDSIKTTPWGLHYTASILMIKENPMFGNGFKSFREDCSKYKHLNIREQRVHKVCSSHPHNFHLEVMVDSGILGYLILLTSVYFFLKRYFQFDELKKNKLVLVMFLYLLTFLFFPRPTGSILSTFFGSMFWYFVGSILGYTNLKK